MKTGLEANTGSFRDPVNRVYEVTPKSSNEKIRILRGLSKDALAIYQKLSGEAFFRKALDAAMSCKRSCWRQMTRTPGLS